MSDYRGFYISQVCPPIPTRQFDYCGSDGNGPDSEHPTFHGPTEADVKQQIDDYLEYGE